ncbi:hypothetical protein OROHE_014456 [Orobanche hederae]
MLCFQKDPIPTSLLKINSDIISRAGKFFHIILNYMEVDSSDRVTPTSLDERIELIRKLYKHSLKRSELQDELFMQISKQTRNNPDSASNDSEVQLLAMNTLNALKLSVKSGPRHIVPGLEEIEAVLTGKKLTTVVFFLDETFEEITYDMTTTVADAIEELAGIIKLSAYSSFNLFESRKAVAVSKSPEPGNVLQHDYVLGNYPVGRDDAAQLSAL